MEFYQPNCRHQTTSPYVETQGILTCISAFHTSELLARFTQQEMLEGRTYRCEKCSGKFNTIISFLDYLIGLFHIYKLFLFFM
jgi:hypothetical protein